MVQEIDKKMKVQYESLGSIINAVAQSAGSTTTPQVPDFADTVTRMAAEIEETKARVHGCTTLAQRLGTFGSR